MGGGFKTVAAMIVVMNLDDQRSRITILPSLTVRLCTFWSRTYPRFGDLAWQQRVLSLVFSRSGFAAKSA